jgi:glycolate oxidase iron-sulfur subunit
VLSANPGCLLQRIDGSRRRGLKAMPAFHMLVLLDASIRGLPASVLLRETRLRRLMHTGRHDL